MTIRAGRACLLSSLKKKKKKVTNVYDQNFCQWFMFKHLVPCFELTGNVALKKISVLKNMCDVPGIV